MLLDDLAEGMRRIIQEEIESASGVAKVDDSAFRVFGEGQERFWEHLLRILPGTLEDSEQLGTVSEVALNRTLQEYGERSVPCRLGILSAYLHVSGLRAAYAKGWVAARDRFHIQEGPEPAAEDVKSDDSDDEWDNRDR